MNEILDINDSRIQEFISMRDHLLNKNNLIVVEAEKLFLQFKANNKTIYKLLATKSFLEKHNLQDENFFYADKALLDSIAGFKLEYEVLFLAERPQDFKINELDDRIILLNGLTSPENVGSIVRSSAAFGIKSIVTDEKTCSPFLRRCIRVSMGNIFSMKTYHSKNIRQDLQAFKELGYTVLSTANLARSKDLSQYSFPQKCVLIIGSEGHGVDQDILDTSDAILKINIDSQVAHLNASNAAAIFLSHMSLIK